MFPFDGDLVLFGSTTSPFVRKARVALLEKGLAHRFELRPPWSPTSGVDALNPLSKVPALALANGDILFDSRVIVQYLELRKPRPALLPDNPGQRLAALRIEALADGVGDAAALRIQETWRQPAAQSPFWIERQMAKVKEGLAALDRDIEPFLPAPGSVTPLNLACIATGSALGFVTFWLPELAWRAERPHLERLWHALETRPSWQQTQPYLAEGARFPSL